MTGIMTMPMNKTGTMITPMRMPGTVAMIMIATAGGTGSGTC
jgi:hypothetical protein